MASIDERVVAMSFENTKFEADIRVTMRTLQKLDAAIKNIGQTSGLSDLEKAAGKVTFEGPMSALDKLKQKLNFGREAPQAFSELENAGDKVQFTGVSSALDKLKTRLGFPEAPQAFSDLEASSNKVSFMGVSRAIDGISGKLSTLQVTAGVAFGNIASMALQKVGGIGKSLTFDPILTGFQNYSTNLNSVQTILANTADSGGTLKTVNAALQDMNKYANLTIYDFSQMARNVGTFTAAGVQLKPATESIKGIANLAALSGSNAEQASTAMYQISQAIAAGRVSLQDWNSVVNAGMGGAVFQHALERTGVATGTIAAAALKVDKATGKATINGQSFRESITAKPGQRSWLTSDVLVKTLQQFTGDLTTAQLAAQGFNAEQIKAIQSQAKTARDAATKVKTVGQLMDVMKESVASGWSQSFKLVVGNFEEARKSLSKVSDVFSGIIQRSSDARNKVLTDWRKLGGRDLLIKGISAAFHDLLAVLKPIREAFREFFPKKTGSDLFRMTQNFTRLMEALKPSNETLRNLKRIFAGIFAVMHIGLSIVKGVAGVFFDLLGTVSEGSGGFLDFAANIGDMLVNLDKALTKGGILTKFFERLDAVLKGPLKLLGEVAGAIGDLFGKSDSSGLDSFRNSVGDLGKKLSPFSRFVDAATKSWAGFTHMMGKVKDSLSPLMDNIASVIANFGKIVADGIKNADYSAVFAAVNTVLLGGIFIAIKKALGINKTMDLGGGIVKNISSVFETLTGSLKSMQRNVQAKTILEIAIALAILAVGIIVLSTIDPKKLASAMTALAVGMGELVGAMAILQKTAGGTAFLRMPFIAGSLILLAGAMIIMAAAAKIFATMSWQEIAKGLAGVAGSLVAVNAATQFMNGPKLIAAGLALIPIAIGINLLAGAAKIFATMSWKDIGKGLAGIGGTLLAIGVALQAFPADSILLGPSLILIAIGIGMLTGSVLAFGHMDTKVLVKGILAIAGSLVAIGIAINAIPPTIALQAAGLIILGAALAAISGVVAIFGRMNLHTLVQGILAMGAAMIVLAIGLTAMEGTLVGAAALVAAAAAFAVLVPAIALLGVMSWSKILHGLGAMVAIIAVLAVAGLLAGPALVALGVGLAAIGIGMLFVSGAVYLFAKGMSLLSGTTVKAVASLLAAGALFIAAFPNMVINFVKGLLDILNQVSILMPKIVSALVNILGQLIDGIIVLAPKAATAITALITAILKILNDNAQPMIDAGFRLLNSLLVGMAQNIGPITDNVALIIVNFLNALAAHMPDIIAAGVNLITSFISGITAQLPNYVTTVISLITTFIGQIAAHIGDIVAAAGGLVTAFIVAIANQALRFLNAGLTIVLNFLLGIAQSIPTIVQVGLYIAKVFLTSLATGLLSLIDLGFQTLINFLNGLADSIRKNEPDVIKAGFNIAEAIGEGMLNGLTSIAPNLVKKVGGIAGDMVSEVESGFGIWSPSHVFHEIGKNLMQGLSNGITKNAFLPFDAMTAATGNVVKAAKQQFGSLTDAFHHGMGGRDIDPVIKPVLDLSNVKKNAPNLKKLLDKVPKIDAKVSAAQAAAIAKSQAASAKTATAAKDAKAAPSVHFTQNNYSPENLSHVEIYRQTNNQIARLQRSLTTGTLTTA